MKDFMLDKISFEDGISLLNLCIDMSILIPIHFIVDEYRLISYLGNMVVFCTILKVLFLFLLHIGCYHANKPYNLKNGYYSPYCRIKSIFFESNYG